MGWTASVTGGMDCRGICQTGCFFPGRNGSKAAKKSKISENTNDWMQGYGYQMWRCRHNAYRADGADGQYILIIPEKDAVIAVTAHIGDMQAELDLIWKYLLPAL